jgi:hypothetical protein
VSFPNLFICPLTYTSSTLSANCISIKCYHSVLYLCPEYTPNPNCYGSGY